MPKKYKYKPHKPVAMKITKGEIIVEHGIVLEAGRRVVALCIDLRSKYAFVLCTGSNGGIKVGRHTPLVCLEAGEETLYTDKRRKGKSTEIEFPEFVGWSVHSTDIGRYTLSVCLVRR